MKRDEQRTGRFWRSGQALPEFAIVLPVLLLFIMGIVDFGRAIYAYNAVSNAARMGVRTAIVNQNPDEISSRAAAQATSLGINPTALCTAPSGVCVEFKDSTQQETCTDLYGADLKSCVAIVTVKYTYTAITPIIGNLIGGIPLTSTSIQAIESECATPGGCPIP